MAPNSAPDQAAAQISIERSDAIYRRMRSPAFLRYYYKMQTVSSLNGKELLGSSPTDIFIGRLGYPKVNVGPLIPPQFGDTSIMSRPEQWRGIGIEKLVEMRTRLVRGMQPINIHDVEKGRLAEQMRDLALAQRPSIASMNFDKKPTTSFTANGESEPFGPSVIMKGLELENLRYDHKVERGYLDTDATASTSMVELYRCGVEVSKIQRALSAGTLGVGKRRKFVPTRWSITAVDDTLSKSNLEKVKGFESIDAIQAYYNVALDNRYLIFLLPANWEYESIEAFYPNTTWNEGRGSISIFSSHEGYRGRRTYAEMGGCYYSGRLAVTEKLLRIKRQARALILREVHEGYIMPMGVWNVREHVRQTLECEPTILGSVQDMLSYINPRLDIEKGDWIRNSSILANALKQRRITDCLSTHAL